VFTIRKIAPANTTVPRSCQSRGASANDAPGVRVRTNRTANKPAMIVAAVLKTCRCTMCRRTRTHR
jgi:hypothetical protein